MKENVLLTPTLTNELPLPHCINYSTACEFSKLNIKWLKVM